ncbi:MAG: FeoB-associated Cys-rich membrane protein [Fusobacterium sp.]|nr:FeoB-associated Cys-rich membrane protein [Fusobacterium sp.]
MNLLSMILVGAILIYLVFSIVYIYKNKKKGKGCGGNCTSCSKNCR